MKKFLKRCVVTYPWVVAFSLMVPSMVNKRWDIITFCGQLLVAVVVIFLLQLFTNRFVSNSFLLEIGVEFTMVMAVVYFFGWIWNWYTPTSAWMMVAIILPVYILGYIVGVTRTKKDLQYINACLKERKSSKVLADVVKLDDKVD